MPDRVVIMKYQGCVAVVLALSANPAFALGLDRPGGGIDVIFEDGGYVAFGYGLIQPDISGREISDTVGGVTFGDLVPNVGDDVFHWDIAVKMDIGGALSFALIVDQPYGIDIAYTDAPDTNFTTFTNTSARLDTLALTAIGRYRFNDSFSVHGGLRQISADGQVRLAGLAYRFLNGYTADLQDGSGTGWLAGAAYERADMGLRAALTYTSAVDIRFDVTERGHGGRAVDSTETMTLPETWDLAAQIAVRPDTLLFGEIRHEAWSQTVLSPPVNDSFDRFDGPFQFLSGPSLFDYADATTYRAGVEHAFTDSFSASLAGFHKSGEAGKIGLPFSPTNGFTGLEIGARYRIGALEYAGTVGYLMFNDTQVERGNVDLRAIDFADNDALFVDVTVAYRF